jgi:flagellar FliL protein
VPEKTEESSSSAPPEKKKGKLTLYTISTIPIVTILAFFLVTKVVNPRFADPTHAEVADLGSAPAYAGGARKPNRQGEGHICELGSVLVNPSGTESRRIMKLNILIEVASKSLIQDVEKAKPKLRHQIIMLLSSKELDTITSPEGKSAIQNELKDIFMRELGLESDELRQVYFGEFVIQ